MRCVKIKSKVETWKEKVDRFFKDSSKDELIIHLEKSGFEFIDTDGSTNVRNFTEEELKAYKQLIEKRATKTGIKLYDID